MNCTNHCNHQAPSTLPGQKQIFKRKTCLIEGIPSYTPVPLRKPYLAGARREKRAGEEEASSLTESCCQSFRHCCCCWRITTSWCCCPFLPPPLVPLEIARHSRSPYLHRPDSSDTFSRHFFLALIPFCTGGRGKCISFPPASDNVAFCGK